MNWYPRFLRCPEEGCMLTRWHRNAHYRQWENGVWQMWTDDLDFGMTPRAELDTAEVRDFIQTFESVVHVKEERAEWWPQ